MIQLGLNGLQFEFCSFMVFLSEVDKRIKLWKINKMHKTVLFSRLNENMSLAKEMPVSSHGIEHR